MSCGIYGIKIMGRPFRDFTKVKIGRLQPLYIDETKPRGAGHNIYWVCQCDCGNLISVNSSNLRSGERAKRNMSCGKCHAQLQNLIGKTFGKLTVIGYDDSYKVDKTNGWNHKWICQCECGNTVSVFGGNLTQLHTTSCGCASRSIGEQNIENLLKQNNIKYKKEYSFSDLKSIKKLRFDFAIFDDKNSLIELIEFDGRQHKNDYTPWNTTESLQERQFKDNLKDEYCKEHNIKLVRISYEKRDNITLKELELENNGK